MTQKLCKLSNTELYAEAFDISLGDADVAITAHAGNLTRAFNSTVKNLTCGMDDEAEGAIRAVFELGRRAACSEVQAKRPKLLCPADVSDVMLPKMRHLEQQIVVALALDTKGGIISTGKAGEGSEDVKWGKVLGESTIFKGTLNDVTFHPREIFRFAVEEGANSVILVHNHPSGDPTPSQADIKETQRLVEVGKEIGIKVLDHIIIGDGVFVSMKEENFI